MIKSLFIVFLGGGLGSCLRYLFSFYINNNEIKWIPTLVVNLLGCLLLGAILAYYDRNNLSQNLYILLGVGLCGGLTTFSTLSAELFFLLRQQQYFNAAAYFIGSSALGIAAIYLTYNWFRAA